MAKRLSVFKCEKCGSMVEVLHEAGCDPSCCGQPMKQLIEGTSEGAKEKHIPVIEKTAEGYKVSVGSIAHPMEPDHFIEWFELVVPAGGGREESAHRQWLKPGDKPEAFFPIKAAGVWAREYCNKHGLWKA